MATLAILLAFENALADACPAFRVTPMLFGPNQ